MTPFYFLNGILVPFSDWKHPWMEELKKHKHYADMFIDYFEFKALDKLFYNGEYEVNPFNRAF